MFSNIIYQDKADENFLNQAYSYANKVSDISLIEILAKFVEIDSPVDRMISERTELSVLKIWAARPGRPTEDVLKRFAKESRSTLLLDLAQMEDMPEKFYENLAKRKSIHLAWNLIANPSVSSELKTSLAENLGKNTNITNRSIHDRVRPLYLLPAEFTLVFLNANSNEKALRVISELAGSSRYTSDPSPWDTSDRSSILLTVLDRLSHIVTESNESYSNWDTRSIVSTVCGYENYSDTDTASLLAKLESTIKNLPHDSDLYSTFRSSATNLAKRQVTDFGALLDGIRTASTPAGISSAVHEYRSVCYSLNASFDIEAAGRAALGNPNADVNIFRNYAHCLTSATARNIASRAIESDNPELCAEVFARSFSGLSNDLFTEFFDNSADPTEFVYWLLNKSTQAPYFMTGSAAFVKNVDLAFKFLPASTVLQNSQYSAKVSEVLQETLGSDPESWETFTSLASEWSGSFTDLVKAAGSLLPE